MSDSLFDETNNSNLIEKLEVLSTCLETTELPPYDPENENSSAWYGEVTVKFSDVAYTFPSPSTGQEVQNQYITLSRLLSSTKINPLVFLNCRNLFLNFLRVQMF
jgi:hypothetical protein